MLRRSYAGYVYELHYSYIMIVLLSTSFYRMGKKMLATGYSMEKKWTYSIVKSNIQHTIHI